MRYASNQKHAEDYQTCKHCDRTQPNVETIKIGTDPVPLSLCPDCISYAVSAVRHTKQKSL